MNPLGPPTVRPVARFSFALRIPVAWFLCGNERGQKRGGRVQVAGRIALCCWQAFATEVCPSLSARRSRTVAQVRRNYIAIERFVCGTCLELPARHAHNPPRLRRSLARHTRMQILRKRCAHRPSRKCCTICRLVTWPASVRN